MNLPIFSEVQYIIQNMNMYFKLHAGNEIIAGHKLAFNTFFSILIILS